MGVWVLVVVGGLSVCWAAISCGWWPPFYADTLIRVHQGKLLVRRGIVRAQARAHVLDLLREAGVSRGFIAIRAGNRVAFSRGIPAAIHQQLRNVLLNQ